MKAKDHGVTSGISNPLKDGDNKWKSVSSPNTNDPPKFSQMTETLKDVFVKSLQDFFTQEFVDQDKITEIPNITTFESSSDNSYRSANFIRRHFGKNENLPQVVVYASSGNSKRLAFNNTFIDRIFPFPRLYTSPGPFTFPDRAELRIRTKPKRRDKWQTTSIVIPAGDYDAQELAALFNEQSRLVTAEVSNDERVYIYPNGELQKLQPRVIEVEEGNEIEVLDQLGLITFGNGVISGFRPNATLTSIGSFDEVRDDKQRLIIKDPRNRNNNISTIIKSATSDDLTFEDKGFISEEYTGQPVNVSFQVLQREDHLSKRIPPLNRYCHRRISNVVIQVLGKDEQTREELADIIMTYYEFYMQENFYTYWGRALDDLDLDHNERYQIVLSPNIQNSSEQELQRTNDQKDKIYILQLTVPVEIMYYIDRELVIDEGIAAGESMTLEGSNIKFRASINFGDSIN